MAFGINRCELGGYLTRDPKLKTHQKSNTPYCNFGLAITTSHQRKLDGGRLERTCFVCCSAFGRRAEVIAQWFKKGDPIIVYGQLRYYEWQNSHGETIFSTDIMVDDFSFLPGGKHRLRPAVDPSSNGNGQHHPVETAVAT